ncbi:GIY-YIG nuclease family protein [Ktedonobacter racemifer]|uniref:Group I intron endonuclease n=1 Tax=Ktedonobacter racemifer DSM 44963 TaxID=485913 RepID=D6TZN2_KTERA|nr:GIY-YIG nuclease family protein [Ktedonobacter racemifer]EFH82022.1 group I intron endonuclease [Ktedonobacter racemifer DSM 44963]
MTEKPGIYAIRHLISGKVYIGSASNISKRWHRHKKDLRLGRHKNEHLQYAWTKYGEEAFVFEILELTSELDLREQFWIDYTGCINPDKGYNRCPTARSSRGFKRGPESEEYRKRKSLFLKGKCGIGNASPVHRGVDNHLAKLTENDVHEIRRKYGQHTFNGKGRKEGRNGGVTYQSLADEYGVSMSTIHDIILHVTWRHVT